MDPERAKRLAVALLDEAGVYWRVGLNLSTGHFVRFSQHRRSLSLNAGMVQDNPEPVVRAVLVHALAHICSKDVSHSAQWWHEFALLGGDVQHPYPLDIVAPRAPWLLVCPDGHAGVQAWGRPTGTYRCRTCGTGLVPQPTPTNS